MPAASPITIHILAAVAEHERKMISQRTKAALEVAKARGTKLGNPRWQESLATARAARQLTSLPAELVQQIERHRAEGWTLRRIAAHLDATRVPTPRGARWRPETVRTTLQRAR